MARVSLIALRAPGVAWPSDRVATYRAGLEEQGYSVEVLTVRDPLAIDPVTINEPWCRVVDADGPGLVESAVSGLRAARGNLLVLVDLSMPYRFEDVLDLVETLAGGQVDLAIASRPQPRLLRGLSRRILGTTDPTSGLVGLNRASLAEADDSFAPVGSQFTLELLARVAGRRGDIPVQPVRSSSPLRLSIGEARQLKRLADDRFGLFSRLVQFCFVGASGMVVDLTAYAAFQWWFSRTSLSGLTAPLVGGSLDLAVAAVLSVSLALTWNFSINRRLTFNDARAGSIPLQFVR